MRNVSQEVVVRDVDLHLAVSLSTSKDTRTLKVSCFSKEPKEDDLVGAGEVDITDVLETGEFDGALHAILFTIDFADATYRLGHYKRR